MIFNNRLIILHRLSNASHSNVGLPTHLFFLGFSFLGGLNLKLKTPPLTTTTTNQKESNLKKLAPNYEDVQLNIPLVFHTENMKNEVKFEVYQISNQNGKIIIDTLATSLHVIASFEETDL